MSGGRAVGGALAEISLYLGEAKYFWTYLALKANPMLMAALESGITEAIFFDDPALLPEGAARGGGAGRRYFYVFWDGLTDASALDKAQALLGAGARMMALVVGDLPASTGYEMANLYPDGVLRYAKPRLRFDARTAAKVRMARLKTVLMPLKNLLQSKKSRGTLLGLLLGGKRVVFCGSYGTIPKSLAELCERRGVEFRLFDGYAYFGADADQTFANYRRCLGVNGAFLAELYGRGQINGEFLLSAFHLMGREYFIERIRSSGMKMFANGYASGINVNVYTTPFYGQHVFPDFGSVAGTGNYPRLADLAYFGKTTVRIRLAGDAETLARAAGEGRLVEHFDLLWDGHVRQIEEAMG